MEKKNIVTYVDYGTIKFDIKTLMKKKKITKSQLVKRTGLHHQIIERYMSGNITRYDKDILAKLCYVLEGDLEDILRYEEPKK